MWWNILAVIFLIVFLFLAALYAAICFLSVETPSLRLICKTIFRDIRYIYVISKVVLKLKKYHRLNYSILDLFEITAKKYRDKVCFVIEDKEWTYKEFEDFVNKIANIFLSLGYKKGDEVALVLENCPEYVGIWLGLSKIGVVTALINTNQREEALGHSVNILNTKAIIFGKNFTEAILEALPFFDRRDAIKYYCYSEENENVGDIGLQVDSLNSLLVDASPKSVHLGRNKPGFSDKLFYIYTSGTTGLPKAAIIKHNRYLWIAVGAVYGSSLSDYETFYNPLPMYHTAGGTLFLSVVLTHGGKMVIRKKFSASNFWKDVSKHKATVSQYIGEICRYLLCQPHRPEETQHCLRVMLGNGLRPHLWREFQERFNIKHIVEVYGSTEGNANFANFFDKVGAVGIIPRLCDRISPAYLMKVNPETGDLLRNKDGLCVRCKAGEPGEMVGKIIRANPLNSFDGYLSKNETNKKIATNCFQQGDTVFRSGDILMMDEEGYLYFVDRTGDTYRWKGENVSTGEVENIVSKALEHSLCVVYGVEIPKTEGRAGMAAVQIDVDKIDFNDLYKNLKKKLPPYSIPMFLRISKFLEITGTFKLRKVVLQEEGYNPERVSDPLFFIDHKTGSYVPLTNEVYTNITNGNLKL